MPPPTVPTYVRPLVSVVIDAIGYPTEVPTFVLNVVSGFPVGAVAASAGLTLEV